MLGSLFKLVFVNVLGNLLRLARNGVRLLRRRPRWVHVVVAEPLPARPARLGPWRQRGPSLAALEELADGLAADPRVEGVLVELRPLGGSWARAQSLRQVLARLRARGKRVVAHLSAPGLRELYVACAADEIQVDESGPLGLVGLAAEATFLGEALRRAGVQPELEYRGPYKSFAETLTRTDMSPAHREALDAILDGLFDDVVAAVAAGRRVEPARAAELVAGGPYTAEDARRAGLVDAIGYADELAERLRAAPARAWRAARFLPLAWRPLLRRRRSVRVLPLHGAIVGGEGGGRTLGADAAVRALAAARKDPAVVAVVLHINSRGGAAGASDLIWRAVARTAQAKPVVAYLDDVAASGGYYIACGATRIVAQPATLTGSIGVVAGKMSIGGLLERLGVATTVLTRGPAAAMSHATRGYSDEERRRLVGEIDAVYRQFVRRVADGRKLDGAAAEAVAGGRVWLGSAARARGLVDELGGMEAALALARRLAARPAERVEEGAVTPRRRSLLARLVASPISAPFLEDLALLARERALLLAPHIVW
jgi:protease-4